MSRLRGENRDISVSSNAYDNLAMAIVQQAVQDWRDLCNGKDSDKNRQDYNVYPQEPN